MKSAFYVLFSLVLVQTFSFNAHGAAKKRTKAEIICTRFQAKEDLECAHLMCDDDVANGTYKNLDDCTSAEDYSEAAQGGCDGQPTTVAKLVRGYNKKHPNAKIKCD